MKNIGGNYINNIKDMVMKQFNLMEYLANPSRKIVTRDGRNVRIICTDKKGTNFPKQLSDMYVGNIVNVLMNNWLLDSNK